MKKKIIGIFVMMLLIAIATLPLVTGYKNINQNMENQLNDVECWSELKLISSDGTVGDHFGLSVDVSKETCVVGAHNVRNDGVISGAAYVFDQNYGGINNWGEVAKLKLDSSERTHVDKFGRSVSISDDTIVVGAYGHDEDGDPSNPDNKGAAYVFQRNEGGPNNWGQVAKLTAGNDGQIDDEFGFFVAISGDIIVVGARYGDGNVVDSGSAYVFERNKGGVDNWGQVAKLTAGTHGQSGDQFGTSVAISGDIIVVGAPIGDGNVDDSGSVYVFKRSQGGSNSWPEVEKIFADDGEYYDNFGVSIDIYSDTIIVGAYFDTTPNSNYRQGSAYIFKSNQAGTNWNQIKHIYDDSNGEPNDQFGVSVSVSHDTVVVGARFKYGDGDYKVNTRPGSIYIFNQHYNPETPSIPANNNWGRLDELFCDVTCSEIDNSYYRAYFGHSVAVCCDTIIAGAGRDKIGTKNKQGSAFIISKEIDMCIPSYEGVTYLCDTSEYAFEADPEGGAWEEAFFDELSTYGTNAQWVWYNENGEFSQQGECVWFCNDFYLDQGYEIKDAYLVYSADDKITVKLNDHEILSDSGDEWFWKYLHTYELTQADIDYLILGANNKLSVQICDLNAGYAGGIWCLKINYEPISDLKSEGSIDWSDVSPDSVVTSSFSIENIGEECSDLNWKIEDYPTWGSWTFTPDSGTNLKPYEGLLEIEVEVEAPSDQNSDFSGEIKIVNEDDVNDYEIIPISLSTPRSKEKIINTFLLDFFKNQPIINQFFNFLYPLMR